MRAEAGSGCWVLGQGGPGFGRLLSSVGTPTVVGLREEGRAELEWGWGGWGLGCGVVLQRGAGSGGGNGGVGLRGRNTSLPPCECTGPAIKGNRLIPDAKSCVRITHPGVFTKRRRNPGVPRATQATPRQLSRSAARATCRLMRGLASCSGPLPPPPSLSNPGAILS